MNCPSLLGAFCFDIPISELSGAFFLSHVLSHADRIFFVRFFNSNGRAALSLILTSDALSHSHFRSGLLGQIFDQTRIERYRYLAHDQRGN